MTSVKIYLQQSHRFQDFFHSERTSYARKCTKPLVQRYKAKHALRQNLTKLIKLFDFLFFIMCFWIFDKKKKKNDKSQQCKNI